MTDSPFRPFETHLDRDTALNILENTLIGADDGELFLERCQSEVISFDDGRLRTSSFDAAEGFGLRAVQGETVGYAHSTEVSEQAMRRATGTVRLAIGAGGGSLHAATCSDASCSSRIIIARGRSEAMSCGKSGGRACGDIKFCEMAHDHSRLTTAWCHPAGTYTRSPARWITSTIPTSPALAAC